MRGTNRETVRGSIFGSFRASPSPFLCSLTSTPNQPIPNHSFREPTPSLPQTSTNPPIHTQSCTKTKQLPITLPTFHILPVRFGPSYEIQVLVTNAGLRIGRKAASKNLEKKRRNSLVRPSPSPKSTFSHTRSTVFLQRKTYYYY